MTDDMLSSVLDQVGPVHVIEDFLPEPTHQSLLDWAIGQDEFMVPTGVRDRKIEPDIRKSRHAPSISFRPWHDRLKPYFDAAVPDILSHIGIATFAIDRFEIDMVSHNDGDFFSRHIDIGRGQYRWETTRIVSMVYYFHAQPKGFAGGALRFHPYVRTSANEHKFVDIEPINNRLVAFGSTMPHEVMPISCPSRRFADSRFSINCWVHAVRKQTPAA